MPQQKFGRILVDDTGIALRAWYFFGKDFQMSWKDLEAFAVSETVPAPQAAGAEKIVNQTLELHSMAAMEIVDPSETGGHFDELVAYLRNRCPEKEKQSFLAMYNNLSPSDPDAVNMLLRQFDDVIREELKQIRRQFPHPTKAERVAIYKVMSHNIATAKNLSTRHAKQIVFWYCERYAPDLVQGAVKPTDT